jgi:hypothetical protein
MSTCHSNVFDVYYRFQMAGQGELNTEIAPNELKPLNARCESTAKAPSKESF